MKKDPSLLRAIIMDHYEYPRNKSLVDNAEYKEKHMSSASCIDDIKVQLKVKNHIIEDIRFDGVGCTISTAATSIMVDLLMNKSVEEAKYIITQYMNMIKQIPYDEEVLQEAICMEGVGKQANRINCATLGVAGIESIIKELEEEEWKEK